MQERAEQKAALSGLPDAPDRQGIRCPGGRHYAGRWEWRRGLSLGKHVRKFIYKVPQSIYGGKFNDDKAGLKTKFKKGSLAMANSGKNTNSSQFFVVLADEGAQLAKLDGKYVHFGELRDGWEVLDALDGVGGGADETPIRPAWVGGCGLL